jgi:segregation and condensation protein B
LKLAEKKKMPQERSNAEVMSMPEGEEKAETMGRRTEQAGSETDQLLRALECVLFAAQEAVEARQLSEILEVEESQARDLLARLEEEYENSGLQIVRLAGGYRMATRPEYAHYVQRLRPFQRYRLSRAALETLAIIAYRQPITKPEIEALRGVNADGVIETLLERGLVEESGRKKTVGRPLLYRTTTAFLEAFGLESVAELPAIKDES